MYQFFAYLVCFHSTIFVSEKNKRISDNKTNIIVHEKQSSVKNSFVIETKMLETQVQQLSFCIFVFSTLCMLLLCIFERVLVIMEEEDVRLGCSEFYSLPLWDLWHFPFYFLLHYRKTIFSEEYINSTKYVVSHNRANSSWYRNMCLVDTLYMSPNKHLFTSELDMFYRSFVNIGKSI